MTPPTLTPDPAGALLAHIRWLLSLVPPEVRAEVLRRLRA